MFPLQFIRDAARIASVNPESAQEVVELIEEVERIASPEYSMHLRKYMAGELGSNKTSFALDLLGGRFASTELSPLQTFSLSYLENHGYDSGLPDQKEVLQLLRNKPIAPNLNISLEQLRLYYNESLIGQQMKLIRVGL